MYNYDNPRYRAKVWENIKWGAILAVVLWMLALATGKAQDKIEGIGKFKVGKTTIGITADVARELGGSIGKCDYQILVDAMEYEPPKISELIKNAKDNTLSPSGISKCPDVRAFIINKYTIADMKLSNVYLNFYKDTLVKVSCEGNEMLNNALQIKYGAQPFVTTKDTIKCYSRLLGETPLEQQTQTREWNSKDIIAKNRIMLRYNERCSPYQTIDFGVASTSLLLRLIECESLMQGNEAENRKSKLKDF